MTELEDSLDKLMVLEMKKDKLEVLKDGELKQKLEQINQESSRLESELRNSCKNFDSTESTLEIFTACVDEQQLERQRGAYLTRCSYEVK